MPYVTVRLTDGLGNRLFQVAALLGYAEKYGHTPIFLESEIKTNTHGKSDTICDLFPRIKKLNMTIDDSWTIIDPGLKKIFTYVELPYYPKNVLLKGWFQSEKYGPSYKLNPMLPSINMSHHIFLHIRRGDYLSEKCWPHNINLMNYYRNALKTIDPSYNIFVGSNDIEWCKKELPCLFGDVISEERWVFSEAKDEIMDLASFAACEGGICANSTFSWWGAYFGKRIRVFMPEKWIISPPYPPVVDLHPTWTTVMKVD